MRRIDEEDEPHTPSSNTPPAKIQRSQPSLAKARLSKRKLPLDSHSVRPKSATAHCSQSVREKNTDTTCSHLPAARDTQTRRGRCSWPSPEWSPPSPRAHAAKSTPRKLVLAEHPPAAPAHSGGDRPFLYH